MKKSLVILMIALIALQFGYAQVPVTLDFNSTNSGRSVNVLASKLIRNRHEVGGGICFNINKTIANDDQMCLFRKRLYCMYPQEFFGIEGFYQIHFLQNLEHIDLFGFYDIQCRFAHDKTWLGRYTIEGNREYDTFGPFHWVEQNIGIGFSVDIWKNLFLIQRLGVGCMMVVGKDINSTMIGGNKTQLVTAEVDYLLTAGIGYRF